MTPSRILLPASLFIPVALAVMPGCSDKTKPTSQAALCAQVGNGTHTQDQCQLGAQHDWVVVGEVGLCKPTGAPKSTVVQNGDAWAGHGVQITACSVIPEADGLQVNVSVTMESQGTVTVNGHFPLVAPNTSHAGAAAVTGLTAVFARADTGQFIGRGDCTASFPRDEMGTQPGGLWLQLDCPNVANASQNRTCTASAELRFENCDRGDE